MAWTEADLNSLERAIADGRGARSITFSDQSVTFGTIDEMLKLRASMKHDLFGLTTSRTYRVASTNKGV
jgi:hypothetical protein